MAQGEPTIDLTAWGQLVFLSILWGGSFLFIGMAVTELPPLVVVFGRVALAVLLLLPFHFWRMGPLPRDRRTWFAFLGMALSTMSFPSP